jgi:hypothetical protein
LSVSEFSGNVGLMRRVLTVIATAVVVIALIGVTSWRNDDATAKAIAACTSQTNGMPFTADEKDIFVFRCMSHWHYSYSQTCGNAYGAECYTPPGFLATKWFEIVDCLRFEEGSYDGSVKGCARKFLGKS